jgi:chemotaxis protein histidine kinase CheA
VALLAEAVLHVAANHGGDVQLWSKPGTGSRFTLRIPTAHNTRRARHQHSSTRDGRDDLVLIAEDSGSIADMLTFLLNKEASSRITGKQRTTISPW